MGRGRGRGSGWLMREAEAHSSRVSQHRESPEVSLYAVRTRQPGSHDAGTHKGTQIATHGGMLWEITDRKRIN